MSYIVQKCIIIFIFLFAYLKMTCLAKEHSLDFGELALKLLLYSTKQTIASRISRASQGDSSMKWLINVDKVAMLSGKREISYRRLLSMIAVVGQDLSRLCKTGDKVAIIGANCPEWVLAMYGAWSIHVTVVPIDFMSTPEEVAYILKDCGPVAVWCDDQSSEKLQQALSMLNGDKPSVLKLESLRSLDKPEIEDGKACHDLESSDEELALIVYTSGTTGSPKGVMLTFKNLRSNTDACSTQIEVFIPNDRVLVLLPLHHAYPLMASVVMPMSIGAASVYAESMSSDAIMAALHDHQVTFIVGVPRLLELFHNSLMQKIRASFAAKMLYKLSCAIGSLSFARIVFKKVQDAFGGHLRYISCGGAAADPQMVTDYYALGFHLLEGYGMTETAPMISFTPPTKHKAGSPGKPIPCNEIKIIDGEVCVKGDNVMKGYYGRPEETAQVMDADGWLHTGDLGYVDDDGFLFLTGRSKELIILGNGKNINPAEIEIKIMEMANGLLSECAVTDDGRNMSLVAVPDMKVITQRGILNIKQTIIDEILEHYNEEVPSYKRIPNIIVRNTQLPRTRLGKLRRHILKKEMAGEKPPVENTAPAPDTPAYRALASTIKNLAGRDIQPDENIEIDIGLDSLAKISLLSSLEKEHGIIVTAEMLAKHQTPRLLAEAIAADSTQGTVPAAPPKKLELPRPSCTHGVIHALTSMFIRCISHLKLSGVENIPDGACIIAPNHQSAIDGLCVGAAMDSKRFKDTYFYAISKFIDGRFSSGFARRHNMIAMELNGDLRQSFALLTDALKQSKTVVIFPEGTRSMDGSLNEFRPTFAQLALECNVPIVPVAIDGALAVLPRGKSFPNMGKTINVEFLKPIMPATGDTAAALAAKTRDLVLAALKSKK